MIFEKLSTGNPISSSRTCKGWGNLSASSNLWTFADCSEMKSSESQFKALKTNARLSKDKLRAIILTLDQQRLDDAGEGIMPIMKRSQKSLKAISLIANIIQQQELLNTVLNSEFDISSIFMSTQKVDSLVPKGIYKTFPAGNLRTLVVDAAKLDSLKSLTNLRTLQINEQLYGKVGLVDLLKQNEGSLESLRLGNRVLATVSTSNAGSLSESFVRLPRLQQL